MHWSLSLLIHAVSTAVCVKFEANCDETPCNWVEGDRYLPSNRNQGDPLKCISRVYIYIYIYISQFPK